MSLRPQVSPAVPEETARVARASFPKGSLCIRLRDELGAVFDDARFAGLFPARGRPAEAPWRLASVTLFQFAGGLPDRQAAEAVRGRIDWKHALALSLTDPGFDSTVSLSEFRSRLVEGRAEQALLDAVLALARERNLLSGGGRQRTDSTHVQTVAAPVADAEATTPAHAALRAEGLLPAVHLVDTGCLDAEPLVTTRRDSGVDLAGPTRADRRWQAREGKGFAASDFSVDWAHRRVTCPRGKGGASWTKAIDNRGAEVVKVEFARPDRGPCQHLPGRVRGPGTRRNMTLRTHEQHTALVEARRRETTPEYAALSAVRAGVEGTISQAVRGFGRAKTHLQHVATAAAMNLVRITEWLGGALPATTRRSKFRALMAEAA